MTAIAQGRETWAKSGSRGLDDPVADPSHVDSAKARTRLRCTR